MNFLTKYFASNNSIHVKDMGPVAQALSWAQRQLYSPPSPTIALDSNSWPNPLQPVRPIGPEGAQPLVFPFNFGQNLNYTPRADGEYSFEDLRSLATYPLARICIENIKDFITKADWSFQLKPLPGETVKQRSKRQHKDEIILKLSRFFEYPDGYNDWTSWVRPLVEDELVIDAPAVQIMRTKSGLIEALEYTRGDAITRYIDERARTPLPPNIAYAQIWQGLPRINFTAEQLVYRPRNIVPRGTTASNLYGFSVVESMADEIQAGHLRLKSVLAYYTKGSIPGLVHVVPSDVTPASIVEGMRLMNSELAGQLEKRKQWRIIQGFRRPDEGPEQIMTFPEPVLADAFDELHIRKMCYGFGVSPQRLVRQMNRASAEAAQTSSEEEGTLVWLEWLRDFVNFTVQRVMGYADYEIVFQPDVESDPQRKALTNQVRVANAQATVNECRADDGLDPDPNPIASKLGFVTGTGFVTLDQMEKQIETQLKQAEALASMPLAAPGEESGQFGGESKTGASKTGTATGAVKVGEKGKEKPKAKVKEKDDKESKTAEETASKERKSVRVRPGRKDKEDAEKYDEPGELEKYDPSQPRDSSGRWSETGAEFRSSSSSARVLSGRSPLTRTERATLTHKPSTRHKQSMADRMEKHLSEVLGLERSRDNSPFDLVGKGVAIEVKTITDNSNNKITVHPDALRRKQAAAATDGLRPFTVVVDKRAGRTRYYVREGVGSFHVHRMEKVRTVEGVRDRIVPQ